MTNKEALKEVKARIEDALLKMIYADGAHSLGAHDKRLLWGFVFGFIARGGAS
jgi:hypothetical protein